MARWGSGEVQAETIEGCMKPKEHPALSLMGGRINGVQVELTGSGRVTGLIIYTVGGGELHIQEQYDECVGWMPFDLSVTEPKKRKRKPKP